MTTVRGPDDFPAQNGALPLTVATEQIPGGCVCALAGDFDLHTRDLVASELDAAFSAHPGVLCLDMEQVHFCDSTGLRLLLDARACGDSLGVPVALVRPSGRVQRLLELTDAVGLLPAYPDPTSAVEDLTSDG